MDKVTFEDLNIVYEDNHIIVVVKPHNVPSQEDSSGDKDMLTLLKEYLIAKYNKTGNAFLGLVHRLDRPTGGVMVFAKTSKAASRLCESIQSGEFEKKYLAAVNGTFSAINGRLDNYLYKDEAKNLVYVAPMSSAGVKRAVLDYKVIEKSDNISLTSIELYTGRSHQIRVQMSHIGCPVIGDVKYGGKMYMEAPNLALWAYEIRFPHPTTRELMMFRVSPSVTNFPWSKFDIDRHMRLKIN